MTVFDRRTLLCSGMVAVVGVTRAEAQAEAEEPDPIVEFDGKVKQNPKCIAAGKVKVTGVVRIPVKHKLAKVVVRRQQDADLKTGLFHVQNATVDMTKSPMTWSVEIDNLDGGDHWFDAQVSYTAPDGVALTADGSEKRRVSVKERAK